MTKTKKMRNRKRSLLKCRDLFRLSIIPRKKGPHKNQRKEGDKLACRKTVDRSEE